MLLKTKELALEGKLPPNRVLEWIYSRIVNKGPQSKSQGSRKTSIQSVAFLSIAAIGLVAAGFSLRPFTRNLNQSKTPARILVQTEEQSSEISPAPISRDSTVVKRALFPYSVIPGGVHSALDLDNAVRNDPVVAAHYGDFDVTKAHIAPVEQDRLVYVSYRIADHIFWTSKRLALSKGETVITDGTHEARTRCGNRISEKPVSPISNEEPSAEMFGGVPEGGFPGTAGPASEQATRQPLRLSLPQTFAELFPEGLSSPSNMSATASDSIPGSGAIPEELPASPGFFPLGIVGGTPSASLPLTTSSGSSGSSGSAPGGTGDTGGGPSSSPSTPSIPVATPEPSSLLSLTAGLFALGVRKARSRRESKSH